MDLEYDFDTIISSLKEWSETAKDPLEPLEKANYLIEKFKEKLKLIDEKLAKAVEDGEFEEWKISKEPKYQKIAKTLARLHLGDIVTPAKQVQQKLREQFKNEKAKTK